MPARVRLVYLGITLTAFLIAGVPLLRELTRPRDIWWTPAAMMVPLEQGRDRVQVYARGEPLESLLRAGRLQIADGSGRAATVAASDVGLRFDNWHRVRSENLRMLLIDAAACGAMAILFLIVATGRLAWRNET